jgi:hypothetical protein
MFQRLAISFSHSPDLGSAYVFAGQELCERCEDRVAAGLRLGMLFVVTNVILDVVVLVIGLKAGVGYFVSLTVWLAYALLLIIPWLTGQSLAKRHR